jgi:predicted acyltransferase
MADSGGTITMLLEAQRPNDKHHSIISASFTDLVSLLTLYQLSSWFTCLIVNLASEQLSKTAHLPWILAYFAFRVFISSPSVAVFVLGELTATLNYSLFRSNCWDKLGKFDFMVSVLQMAKLVKPNHLPHKSRPPGTRSHYLSVI